MWYGPPGVDILAHHTLFFLQMPTAFALMLALTFSLPKCVMREKRLPLVTHGGSSERWGLDKFVKMPIG